MVSKPADLVDKWRMQAKRLNDLAGIPRIHREGTPDTCLVKAEQLRTCANELSRALRAKGKIT